MASRGSSAWLLRKSLALWLLAGLLLSGCVTATIPCPRDRLETVMVQGPDYGSLLTMLLQGATTLTPLLAAQSVAASPTDGTMTVHVLAYGQGNYTCGRAAATVPTPAPTPAALKAPAPESMQETPAPVAMAAPLPPMFVH